MSDSPVTSAFALLQQPARPLRPLPLTTQIRDALAAPSNLDNAVEDLRKMYWPPDRSFVLESLLHREKSRGRRSWIKAYGWFLIELTADNTEKDTLWACDICGGSSKAVFYKAQSTSNAIDHLRKSATYRALTDGRID